MIANSWQHLDRAARNLIPTALLLGLVLLSAVPTRLPYYTGIAPMLTVIGVSYWSITNPTSIYSSTTFGIGMFEDFLTDTSLGLNALVLLCVRTVIVSQQRFFFGKSFFVWWWAFAFIALAAVLLKWLLFVLITETIVHPGEALFSYLITVLIYPAFGRLFASLDVGLVKEG